MIWKKIKLGELCHTVTKGTTPTSIGLDFAEKGIPFLRIQNLSQKSVFLDDVLYIDSETHKSLSRSIIYPKDFLITIAGTIGRTAIVPSNFPECNCNQAIAILRFDENKLNSNFLLYWLGTNDAQQQILGKSVTATISNLSLGQIKELEIPLPPLPIQRHIARVLDQADQLRKQAQQMETELNQLAQAVFLEMFGDPVKNTKNLPTKKLKELVRVQSGGTPSKEKDRYWEGSIPWVSPKDMKKTLINDSIDHISESAIEETSLKIVPIDSVLIVIRGMILAHTVPIALAKKSLTINQDMKAFMPNKGLDAYYFLWHLKAMHNFILKNTDTAAHGTKRLEMSFLEGLEICVPPETLQKKFRFIVEKQDQLLLEAKNKSQELDTLFQSLVQKAFKGELIPTTMEHAA